MTDIVYKIEDYLEILAGFKNLDCDFSIDSRDAILISIARQVYKGTALTDRQYHLVKQKILKYNDQFQNNGFKELEVAVENLRMPLREIDRSKTITIENNIPNVPKEKNDKAKFIKIRFPFNKKTILVLEKIANKYRSSYHHQRGSHSHYFDLKEPIVDTIVSEFKNRNFEIEKQLLDYYEKIQNIKSNPEKYLCCISNGETHKVKDTVYKNYSIEKLIDRQRRFGITVFDSYVAEGLLDDIVNRSNTETLGKPSEYSVQQIVESVNYLDRFPLLVVLEDRNAEDQIYEFWKEIKNIVPNDQQSVLFRLEGNREFNYFVKDKNLNNWVDNSTKIVYINTTKLPKVILSADWNPITAFVYGSSLNRYVDTYIKDQCDLIIYREEELSPMRRYSSYYKW